MQRNPNRLSARGPVDPEHGFPRWYKDAAGNYDKRPTRSVQYTDAAGAKQVGSVTNTVSVTVTYSWNTILFGTIPVSSTSVTPISY